MAQQQFQSCIDACNACADACDYCSIMCLQEPDTKVMARCIALDIDCAQMCRVAAGFMSRGSELSRTICQACVEVCEDCRDECAQYQMEHCKECEKACHLCAQECQRMLSEMPAPVYDMDNVMSTGQSTPH
jgi:hypothetical protein